MELAEYFTNKKAFATTLLAILFSKYDAEFMEWDPMALALQIRDDFGVNLPGSVNDRIQAGTTIFVSNAFHTHFETYCMISNAFSFELSAPGQFIPADLDNCAWGCTESKLLEGGGYDSEGFCQNIKNYVGFLLNREGIYKPPSILNFASYPAQTLETTQESMLDDDIMYSVFWEKQEEKKQEIELITQQRLTDLFTQLKNLPLKQIDTQFMDNVLGKLHKSISTN